MLPFSKRVTEYCQNSYTYTKLKPISTAMHTSSTTHVPIIQRSSLVCYNRLGLMCRHMQNTMGTLHWICFCMEVVNDTIS